MGLKGGRGMGWGGCRGLRDVQFKRLGKKLARDGRVGRKEGGRGVMREFATCAGS